MHPIASPSRLSLTALAAVVLAVVALQPQIGNAVELGGATIETKLLLPNKNGDLEEETTEATIKEYFNRANCTCEEAVFGIEFFLKDAPPALESATVNIWVGTQCDSSEASIRDEHCERVGEIGDIDDLRRETRVTIPVRKLLAPNATDATECNNDLAATQYVYALIDANDDGIDKEAGDYAAEPHAIDFDLRPPPPVEAPEAAGTEASISVRWKSPKSRSDDVRYVQALCARVNDADDRDAFGERGIEPKYLTSFRACGVEDAIMPEPAPGEGDLPEDLATLNPSALCGETTGTSTKLSIDALENGVDYRVVLVVIDEARNATAIDLGTHTPQPVLDGWEHYKEAGGNADGGYCFVATATFGNYDHAFVRILRRFRDDTLAHSSWGRSFIAWYYANSPPAAAFIETHPVARYASYLALAPLVALAAVWEYTNWMGKLFLTFALVALLRWSRKRRCAKGALTRGGFRLRLATIVLVIFGLGSTAHAQPYWDELNQPVDIGPNTIEPHWNVGLRFGPYLPDIDSEFPEPPEGEKKPFEAVFGDDSFVLSALHVERFFLFPLGQLGVTGSIGYGRTKASAFALNEDGSPQKDSDGNFVRAEGSKTSFQLVPTSIGVVYRFTKLDDAWHVPFVPYARASLAYYLWWFRRPGGGTSIDASGDVGKGASLGWEGTVGIGLRAERIDTNAANALRNEWGVAHAGFFAEVQLAKVDGFGADDKLSVGDTTWQAGINFEF